MPTPGKGAGALDVRIVFQRPHPAEAANRVFKPHSVPTARALSAGKLIKGRIQCPFHGFEFDRSGRCVLIPANGKNAPVPKTFQAASYPTEEKHGFIWIWWGEPRAELPPVYFFDNLDPQMTYSTLRDHWATQYSRAIENQLDVVHLPFIHHNTIGRGNRTLVDGPLTGWEREGEVNLLNLWVHNRLDDGSAPLRASQLPPPSRGLFLQFCFPNLWQNLISDDIRVLIAFVPIDEENKLMYVRFYQRFMGAPGLRICEKLIQGDGPIIEYRRKREELLGATVHE